jgi:DivIVA domain-containing protein
VALDRQSIEKRDFPIGRRGYEPEAVDAFLGHLADEFETTQRAQRNRATESLAQAASEQVRAIVEAAETSAADIEKAAEEEAAQIRTDASRDADRTRTEAVDRARDHVGQVSEATATMLQRVSAMQSELDTLVESLRTGANRVSADLAGNLAELYTAAGARTEVPPEPEPVPEPIAVTEIDELEVELEPEAEADVLDESAPDLSTPLQAVDTPDLNGPPVEATVEDQFEPEPVVADEEDEADVEGARLIALNMALNGEPREAADKYLAENFDLGDRSALLDEVYATVEG